MSRWKKQVEKDLRDLFHRISNERSRRERDIESLKKAHILLSNQVFYLKSLSNPEMTFYDTIAEAPEGTLLLDSNGVVSVVYEGKVRTNGTDRHLSQSGPYMRYNKED